MEKVGMSKEVPPAFESMLCWRDVGRGYCAGSISRCGSGVDEGGGPGKYCWYAICDGESDSCSSSSAPIWSLVCRPVIPPREPCAGLGKTSPDPLAPGSAPFAELNDWLRELVGEYGSCAFAPDCEEPEGRRASAGRFEDERERPEEKEVREGGSGKGFDMAAQRVWRGV